MTISSQIYMWIKTIHVIAVFAWWAGLIYIFRLFVYHRKYASTPNVPQVLGEMEAKLLRLIMLPAAVVSVIAGLLMVAAMPAWGASPWLWVKLTGVLGLVAYHALAALTRRRFAVGDYFLSERACRIINEVPTLLLFVIIAMVILKPWSGQ